MLIKLCFQDYVYLYHGKLSIRDLHKFIQDYITNSLVFLKWIDPENEEITIKRDEDLDYVANLILSNFRILVRKSEKDIYQKEIPLTKQPTFGYQPRFLQRTQTQNLDLQEKHKKNTSEDMSQEGLLDNIIDGIMEEVYPDFGIEKISSGPTMVQSQNLYPMRESIPNYRVNRDTIIQHQQQAQQQQTASAILQSRRKSAIPFDKQLYCDYCSNIFHSDSGFYKCYYCKDFEICLECKEKEELLFKHDHALEYVRNQESILNQY